VTSRRAGVARERASPATRRGRRVPPSRQNARARRGIRDKTIDTPR